MVQRVIRDVPRDRRAVVGCVAVEVVPRRRLVLLHFDTALVWHVVEEVGLLPLGRNVVSMLALKMGRRGRVRLV